MKFPDYVEDLFKANELFRDGKTAEARAALDQVEENRPAFPCTVNGEKFSDFRDYNDLTMCVFEVIVKDVYVWIPFEQVQKVDFLEESRFAIYSGRRPRSRRRTGRPARCFSRPSTSTVGSTATTKFGSADRLTGVRRATISSSARALSFIGWTAVTSRFWI